MSKPTGSDPVDQLRGANPIQADDVPDASLARISARIQEHIMSDVKNNPSGQRSGRPLALVGGFALVGALALAIGFGSGFGAQKPGQIAAVPTPTAVPTEPAPTAGTPTDPAPGGGIGMASCIRYDPGLLPTFDVVFDGTITAIVGDQVTFQVGTGWKGADGSVTLTKPGSAISLEGALPDFEVGGRYLVTAAGGNINGCGYTLAYDEATAASWAAAFAN